MNETSQTSTTIAVEAQSPPAIKPHHTVMDISGEMVILTWVMFGITALILYRIAWKPILAALDRRENDIKAALDGAEQARQQAESSQRQCEQMLQQAETEARELVDKARQIAQETAESVASKAREEAKLLLANAEREISFQKEKALNALRQESANLAIEIAGKLIRKNLDTQANRALTGEMLRKL